METIYKIVVCSLVAVAFGHHLHPRRCPQLSFVPVDPDFIFNKQPEDGFYSSYSSGLDDLPDYKTRSMNKKAFKGKHEVCIKVTVEAAGENLFTGPHIDCTYKQSPSAMFCEVGQLGGANALALKTAGIPQIPKEAVGFIVDTDNSTFFAAAACIDGALYQWSLLTVYPHYKTVLSRTANALRVSYKELKDTTHWRFRPGRTKIINGSCSRTDRIVAGVEGIRNGISTIFGG